MSSSRGFSLIEALVAIVIGVAVVVGLGGLGERLIHHHSSTNSNSAAMTLAERQMEVLLADPLQNPSGGTQCATVNTNTLCNGSHTALNLAADGTATNPQYSVQWTVENIVGTGLQNEALVIPTPPTGTVQLEAKKVTITVTHIRNPAVYAQVVRYIQMPPTS